MERPALLSVLVFAGLRISEALELRWRDVDLAGARLKVRQAKTDAGVRQADLWLPGSRRSRLHDELVSLKERAPARDAPSLAFPSSAGTPQDRNRVRNRILAPAIDRANVRLKANSYAPMPEGLTLHALRRTYCSMLSALTGDLAYVMDQMGHTDPGITTIYRKTVAMRPEDREHLRACVEGA
jgi:integrase